MEQLTTESEFRWLLTSDKLWIFKLLYTVCSNIISPSTASNWRMCLCLWVNMTNGVKQMKIATWFLVLIVAVGYKVCAMRCTSLFYKLSFAITKLRQIIIPFNFMSMYIVINPLESSFSRVSARGARQSMHNCWHLRSFEGQFNVLTYRRQPARVSRLLMTS